MIPSEKQELILQLHDSKTPIRKIAKTVRLATQTVVDFLNQKGKSVFKHKTRVDIRDVGVLYSNGKTLIELSNQFNRAPDTIRSMLKIQGIKPRYRGKIPYKEHPVIANLYAEHGLTIEQLATKYKVTPPTIVGILRSQAVLPYPFRKKDSKTKSGLDHERIKTLYEQGASLAAIASNFSCHPRKIRHVLVLQGVAIRQGKTRKP